MKNDSTFITAGTKELLCAAAENAWDRIRESRDGLGKMTKEEKFLC